MKKNPRYQLKHLSVRVPWHDNKWNGTVCNNPKANGACLILKNCAISRDDEKEQGNSGKMISELSEENYPTCVKESGTFMSPTPYYRTLNHPYIKSSPSTHGHLKETKVRFSEYSGSAVPYRWMRKENAIVFNEDFDLGFNEGMEPTLDWMKNTKNIGKGWVQEASNQKALLNCFFEHLEEETSLVFFYAKQVPFIEDNSRVIVGVGKIKKVKESELYEGSNRKFSAAYWEHMIHHSIRTNEKDGFLLPYKEAMEYHIENPEFNPAELAVFSPKDKALEFSYGAEHVSNDSALRVLLGFSKSIERAKELGIGENHDKQLQWIHDRIHELEILRGDYPGMGAALCALGLKKGHFIAAEIINACKKDENPWKKFDKVIDGELDVLTESTALELTGMPIKTYKRYQKREDKTRLNYLYLLSRFDLSQEQANLLWATEKRNQLFYEFSDKDFIENPYLIYQATRKTEFPVDFSTIDLAMFRQNQTKDVYQDIFMKDDLDERRLKALTIKTLDNASNLGHTLLPRAFVIKQIHSLSLIPSAKPNSDHMEVAEELFASHIEIVEMKNGEVAYQLDTYVKTQKTISEKVRRSLKGDVLKVEANWRSLLDEKLEEHTEGDPDENELKARAEKAAALKEMAASRFSVLVGPAGTGKTTLLELLANQSDVQSNGVLFLAPTGKARVRMQKLSEIKGVKVSTIAQFLIRYNRFNALLQQYVFSDKYCEGLYQTVVIDESSMMTEEMMATLLDCFKGVKRFILVGDHRQLPPIGAGRPFKDIIKHLEPENVDMLFPKVSRGYAELTIRGRQKGAHREDLQLAEWFSGNKLGAGDDKIINEILAGKQSKYLELKNWNTEEDFMKCFEEVLKDEFGITDSKSFSKSLGSSNGTYFNSTGDANYFGIEPSIKKIEDWQVLSPVKEKQHGVKAINRKLHKRFKQEQINYVSGQRKRNKYDMPKLPKALGSEEILYGDKVINLTNTSRKKANPDNGLNYLANGEIGLVVGKYNRSKKSKKQPKETFVEFSSQTGSTYTFYDSDFKEEGDSTLELAYAITVHKSQGSEFEKVILVIPDPCFLLTREMLYTALTRQKEKVIILYQGDHFKIKELSSPIHSDTLSRITNLFEAPEMVLVDERREKYLEKNLIHQASDGKLLRSKSELLIYQQLINKELEPLYEKPLVLKEVEKLPDFTILDEYSDKIYYWEHCGMMHDKEYRERWEEKKQWYRDNDILPIEEGGGKNGILIATYDEVVEVDNKTMGAFSVKQVDEYINQIKG